MEATAKDWLDSLSAGTCELSALLRGVSELLRRSPEEGWELLSVVDQYYRRGKISAAVFAALKAHLQGLLMGKNRPEVSVPMPRLRLAGSPQAVASSTIPVSDETPADTTKAAAAVPAMSVGSMLRNRYRVEGILGHGGTGTVFEAVDLYRLETENGQEKVAIKVLHPSVIRRPPLFAELRREFQRLQLLSHPNIVRVHEFDRDGEAAFFTMERLSGVLLSRVIAVRETAPLPRDHAFALLRDIADALGYAHARGVVHGDVSPGNIFVCDDGELRVLDFASNGVATPSFASCQVLEGEAPDARDDVYGLACIAYVLLTGSHPFREQTALEARTSKLTPKRPRGLGTSQWHALRAALSFDRARRPADIIGWSKLVNPRPPAQRLPALPTMMSATDSRILSYRWPALAALAILIVGSGWWIGTHLDSLRLPFASAAPERALPSAPPSNAPDSMTTEPAANPPMEPLVSADVAATPVTAELPTTTEAPPATPAPPAATPRARSADERTNPAPSAGIPAAPTNPGYRARLELSSDNVDVIPADGFARVTVRRNRNLRGAVSFNWWTESGTAKPGRDFSPIASHVEQIEDGKSAVNLVIPIIADPLRKQARNFYVVIDESSPTAAVGPRTLTMVTIPEPDG